MNGRYIQRFYLKQRKIIKDTQANHQLCELLCKIILSQQALFDVKNAVANNSFFRFALSAFSNCSRCLRSCLAS